MISLHHIRVALATVAALTALVALACATSLHRSDTGETPRLTHHTAPLATPDSSVDIQAGIDSLLLGTRYCVHVTPAPAATDGAQRWNVELVQQVPGEVMLDTWRPELGNCPLAPAFVDLGRRYETLAAGLNAGTHRQPRRQSQPGSAATTHPGLYGPRGAPSDVSGLCLDH